MAASLGRSLFRQHRTRTIVAHLNYHLLNVAIKLAEHLEAYHPDSHELARMAVASGSETVKCSAVECHETFRLGSPL